MSPASPRRTRLFLGALVAVLVALAAWFGSTTNPNLPSPPEKRPPGSSAPASPPPVPSSPPVAPSKTAIPPATPSAALRASLLRTLAALRALPPGSLAETQARDLLARLRAELESAELAPAVAAIIEFLRGGEDASTTLPFDIEDGGALATAPSLRTFLLDQLGRLDPLAAAGFSRAFLDAPLTPDAIPAESSLALRNLAWGSPGPLSADDRTLFDTRLAALLQNPAWAARPDSGLLEGFDAAVYSGNPSLVSSLAALLADTSAPATRHAARLALDRLALAADPAVISAIAATPALDPLPGVRAGLLARADVTDSTQRAALETYLRDPAVAEAGKQSFIAAFPLRSLTDGPRLITSPNDKTGEELMAADRAALAVLREWTEDPALAPLRPSLSASITRLEKMLR